MCGCSVSGSMKNFTSMLPLRPASGFLSSRPLCFLRRFAGGQLFAPAGGFVGLALGVVKLHQALQGLGKTRQRLRRYRLLALFHASVAFLEQRLGVGIFLLAEQTAAQLGLCVEG